MIRFNFFSEFGAFERQTDGIPRQYGTLWRSHRGTIRKLFHSEDGDYSEAASLVKDKGVIGEQLANELGVERRRFLWM